MKTTPYALGLLTAAIALASGSALAVDIRIDGFASIAYGQALDKDELGVNGEFQGYNNIANFQQDSLYGIQFRSNLSDGLSAVGQVVGRGSADFEADITWAYLAYQFNNNWSLKAGRQRIPFFLYSDYLDVSYAYTWISPPASTYDLGGFDNIDGVNLQYIEFLGSWTSRLQLVFGASETEIELSRTGDTGTVSTDNNWAVNWNLNYNWFTFQIIYSQTEVDIPVYDSLASGIGQIAPLTPEQTDLLTIDGDQASYAGVGMSADLENWLFVTEYVESELEDSPVSSDRVSWYVMGGYRWNKFTFALTYSEVDSKNNSETTAFLNPLIGTMDALTNALPAGSFEQYSLAQISDGAKAAYYLGQEYTAYNLTVRYDFHPSAAFKVDYTETDLDSYAYAGVQSTKPAIVRMAIDLVF